LPLIIRAPTGKPIGSKNVTKIGTDGFTRRINKKEDCVATFKTASTLL